ncbi:hypothetical protein [Guptibacillus hwajinpoensis]|uniref:hypothetical protein n=1 Tax=Guptibacillus hwajinpoensis TaxID=208199 RepID=UPI00273EC983|nr:hypothetical protein [Pseudalkalibacillus hwajinpoensis]WLR61224.1 hypothetical protein LC071_07925 [Pseudalkalibacillus hwajinpoensis]
MRKLTYLLITGLLIVVLAACGGNEESSNDKKEEDTNTEEQAKSGEQEQPEVDKVDADKVVATVNGEEIKGEDFNALYSQSQMQYVQMG